MKSEHYLINDLSLDIEQTFIEFYGIYHEKLHDYIHMYTKNASIAQDIAQDVFL